MLNNSGRRLALNTRLIAAKIALRVLTNDQNIRCNPVCQELKHLEEIDPDFVNRIIANRGRNIGCDPETKSNLHNGCHSP